MSLFTGKRLAQRDLQLDIEGLRHGFYSDKYFHNVVRVLESAKKAGYTFAGKSPRITPETPLNIGDVVVEAQLFNRRLPYALVGGVDVALIMLRYATGYYEGQNFIETWRDLDVTAVEDGVITDYDGDVATVKTILEIRGRYRDFALLETPMLGVLTRISRIATNVYEALKATNGKPVLFFPARFDLPETQQYDGYAHWLAVQRYNRESGQPMPTIISTDAQGVWWGGHGGGTVPHALIACFLADTAESMVAFAEYMPVDIPRIALVDFNNDAIRDTRQTLDAYWSRYREALKSDDETEQKRWTLNGVRLDTSASMLDVSLPEGAERGVSPALVHLVRQALDSAWESWNETGDLLKVAQVYCRNVQIVVTGGFNRDKITRFEREGVPVDVYGVGSTFLQNDRTTNTDFTMDVVRVQINGQWVDMGKVGRQPGDNPDLQQIDLGAF
jgi:nicotinate phosphoribosyltransferase